MCRLVPTVAGDLKRMATAAAASAERGAAAAVHATPTEVSKSTARGTFGSTPCCRRSRAATSPQLSGCAAQLAMNAAERAATDDMFF